MTRRCWSSAMLFALGAASSAIDALQALTSSKSTAAKSTGVSQANSQANSFDFFSSSQASTSAGSSSGGGGGSQISPETMSALLAAQSQSSTGTTASASSTATDPLK